MMEEGGRTRSIVLILLLASLLVPASARADSTTRVYDPGLGTLPEAQGWDFFDEPGSATPFIDVDDLHQGPTSTPNRQSWIREDVHIDLDARFDLEATLRVIASGYRAPGGGAVPVRATGSGILCGSTALMMCGLALLLVRRRPGWAPSR